mmetsp:Transcript_73195/g.238038  ORF Transcript_73195/g.238038 Transcript_73195/m.238038 type:complete len:239 (-) Transcript_73195:519-1235(-)
MHEHDWCRLRPGRWLPVDREHTGLRSGGLIVQIRDGRRWASVVGEPQKAHCLAGRKPQHRHPTIIQQRMLPNIHRVKIDADGLHVGIVALRKLPTISALHHRHHLQGVLKLAIIQLRGMLRPPRPSNELHQVALPDLLEGLAQKPILQPLLGRAADTVLRLPISAGIDALYGEVEGLASRSWCRKPLAQWLCALKLLTHAHQPKQECALSQGKPNNHKCKSTFQDGEWYQKAHHDECE